MLIILSLSMRKSWSCVRPVYENYSQLLIGVLWLILQPLKWELKQKPGMSPPRGGFNPDDPNQQIVAEDIFDEYGGRNFFPCEICI